MGQAAGRCELATTAELTQQLMEIALSPRHARNGKDERRGLALRDLFKALGDELIYALASLGGLFGHAAMKLRGNAQ